MELKSNEFRRKNYILDKLGRIQVINEIRENTYICKLSNGKKLKYHFHTSKPIALTEDWLIKFGFEYDRMNGFCKVYTIYQNGNNPFIVLLGSKDWHWWSHQQYSYKHVHQLQNLYFALTQKELILN